MCGEALGPPRRGLFGPSCAGSLDLIEGLPRFVHCLHTMLLASKACCLEPDHQVNSLLCSERPVLDKAGTLKLVIRDHGA